jgi:FtsH-binding integral membrane protein
MQTETRVQPAQQSRKDVFRWISLGAILFAALISMARFAQAYHHRSLTWLCMALLTGASIIFFVKAVRTPTEINKQASMLSSLSAMLYSAVPFLHLLGR